jgi:hypothetical protein
MIMERLPNGNLLTTRWYASNMINGEKQYRVIECTQEWQNGWPVKDARKSVIKGLSREEAETTATMFNRERGNSFNGKSKGFAYDAKLRIDFFTDGRGPNRETAENPKLDFPLVY